MDLLDTASLMSGKSRASSDDFVGRKCSEAALTGLDNLVKLDP